MNDRIKRMLLTNKQFEFQDKVNKGEIKLDFSNTEHRATIQEIDKIMGNISIIQIEEDINILEDEKEILEDQIKEIDWSLRTKKELLDEIKKN